MSWHHNHARAYHVSLAIHNNHIVAHQETMPCTVRTKTCIYQSILASATHICQQPSPIEVTRPSPQCPLQSQRHF